MSTGGKYRRDQKRLLWDFDSAVWGSEKRLRKALRANYNRHIRVWAKYTRWGKSRFVKRINEERRQSYQIYLNRIGILGNIDLKEAYVFLPNSKRRI